MGLLLLLLLVGCASSQVTASPTTTLTEAITLTEVAVLDPPIIYATKERPCPGVIILEAGTIVTSTPAWPPDYVPTGWWCDKPCRCVED